jgi:hypothetical protein
MEQARSKHERKQRHDQHERTGLDQQPEIHQHPDGDEEHRSKHLFDPREGPHNVAAIARASDDRAEHKAPSATEYPACAASHADESSNPSTTSVRTSGWPAGSPRPTAREQQRRHREEHHERTQGPDGRQQGGGFLLNWISDVRSVNMPTATTSSIHGDPQRHLPGTPCDRLSSSSTLLMMAELETINMPARNRLVVVVHPIIHPNTRQPLSTSNAPIPAATMIERPRFRSRLRFKFIPTEKIRKTNPTWASVCTWS